ncbi:PREDICTED: uncharacterized protein LOC108362390 [Rhagoletis zephyria]|uniref:uncharacterized protein LOC108362390 n=1 Tax=Rhagoletis zephyria TaxID=28612 RepID=UPI00081138D5|nr:PREDICTED: uncharacterized protein LOC108362390 [Rhagoletis zephyria]XP_036336728.1 uncharacterized protein LOC118746874 [Rhagoletis pomonella]
MVAVYENNFVEEDPTTLCGWVRNFRIKRSQMKRKLRGNLRVNAMLNTALLTAEAELRRKQRERFCRWAEFQAKLDGNYTTNTYIKADMSDEEEAERREKIDNLWKSELSDLDSFMRSLSSTNRICDAKTMAYENEYDVKSDNCNVLHTIAVVS